LSPARLAIICLCLLPAACVAPERGRQSVDIGGATRLQLTLDSFKDRRDRHVVRQQYDYSCGAAAMATLLTYGLDDPVTEIDVIRAMLATLGADQEAARKKDGFSLLDMQKVAQARGLQAGGYRIAPQDLGKLSGPAIVFVRPRGYEHFAVLRGMRGQTVFLADPARGNLRLALQDFLDIWRDEDGRGALFVAWRPDTPPSFAALAVDTRAQRRPELLSLRQLLEIRPTTSP
jgi:hypothetical protein